MTRAAALRALLLATSTIVPFTAFAQPVSSPAAQSGTADAIRVLLDQAMYWRGKDQDENANMAISRVLVLDPNNADALAMQAQAAADSGATAVANAALAKLKAVRPDDPRIVTVEQALKSGPIDATLVAQARQLAKDGKKDDALKVYRQAFKGDAPPPGLALEYYQAMVGSSEDWTIPRAGLAALVRENPDNLRAQIAYAELLTYHNETRAEGIQRLGRLAQNPALTAQATKDLRESLMWLEVAPDSVPQYEIYLARHPEDKEIAKLADTARNNNGEAKVAGYYAMGNGDSAQADKLFSQALQRVPTDAAAMVGLALARWDEKKYDEARDLLKKAIDADPDNAEQYRKLLDGWTPTATTEATGSGQSNYGGRAFGGKYQGGTYNASRGGTYNAAAARRIQAQFAEVAKLTKAGEFDKAAALLRQLGGRNPSPDNMAYLASIEAQAGHLTEAEQRYRSVLAHSPRNVKAISGLADVLSREGKQAEADTLFAQAARLPGGASVGATRSAALRRQAEQATDPVVQLSLYRQAVDAAPTDPWGRFDLARALIRQNDKAGANAVMAPVIDAPHPTAAQLQAGVYFAFQAKEDATLIRLIDRVPAKQVTPEMASLRTTAQINLNISQAKALGGQAAERDRLLSLASQPDPTGRRVSAYGAELIKLGEKPAARDLVRQALANGTPTPEQRVLYAGTLLGAGYPNEARSITQSVTATGLLATELKAVRNGAAVVASERLNAAGHPAEAYDELAPRLAKAPDDTDLNMALARLYSSNERPGRAVKITQGLLEQNPSNLAVRSSAVYANMADGELRQANALALETTEQFPDEPQAWVDLANVERARGHSGNALRALQTAKELREKQISNQQSALDPADSGRKLAVIQPSRPHYAQYALNIPPNYANDASPAPLPEPISRQYAQYDPTAAQLPVAPPSNSPLVSSGYAPFQALTPSRATAGPAGSAFAASTAGAPPSPSPAPAPSLQIAAAPALYSPAADQPQQITTFLDASEQSNPFTRGSSPLPQLDEPTPPTGTSVTPGLQATDSMIAQIDQNIQQVKEVLAPRVDASLILRGRTGTNGFQRLTAVSAPVEASFSPNGYGRLAVTVTPTYLNSGKGTSSDAVAQFGTNPLGSAGSQIRNQTAFGTALDVRYAYDLATADIGSTPLGFRRTNVIGGIDLTPKLASNLTLHVVAERRAVTDSILSFGGLKDYRTGEVWGAVTRNHGTATLEGQYGLINYFGGAGGGYITGHNVASNTEVDATIGASYPVWHTPTQEVRVGTQLVYFAYNKNLSGFSLGQGGYFSPQDYFAALFPVTYRDQWSPDLRFSVGGTVGFQTFRAKSSNVFPNDPVLQAQLVAASATSFQPTTVSGYHGAGVAGGVNGDIDYRVNGNLHVGARVGFDHSGNYSEGTGLVYARYVFNDAI